MKRWFAAAVGAVVASGVVAVLTRSQLAAVATALTIYAVEMLRPDTPREAVMRRALEKEAEDHLYYDIERKKWHWMSDRELEDRLDLEKRLDADTVDSKADTKKVVSP